MSAGWWRPCRRPLPRRGWCSASGVRSGGGGAGPVHWCWPGAMACRRNQEACGPVRWPAPHCWTALRVVDRQSQHVWLTLGDSGVTTTGLLTERGVGQRRASCRRGLWSAPRGKRRGTSERAAGRSACKPNTSDLCCRSILAVIDPPCGQRVLRRQRDGPQCHCNLIRQHSDGRRRFDQQAYRLRRLCRRMTGCGFLPYQSTVYSAQNAPGRICR